MKIGQYQQELKDGCTDYVLNEIQDGMQVIASIDNKIVIKNFNYDGNLI